ncbi:hypothetical protein BDZ89DRAFT_1140797 [Hymenopellis radicata]|nr:hypothetical protein BDZ89DRAFT_1140797 [Hymenopellis radicata]
MRGLEGRDAWNGGRPCVDWTDAMRGLEGRDARNGGARCVDWRAAMRGMAENHAWIGREPCIHNLGFIKPVAKDDPNLATYLFGYLSLSRGLGNILATPISTSLIASASSAGDLANAMFPISGGRFKNVIVFVGTCLAGAGGFSVLGWGMDFRKRRWSTADATIL